MADVLTASSWKAVLEDYPGGSDLDPVTKAIDAFAKAAKAGRDEPEKLLDAIKRVAEAATKAKAKNASDKKLKPLLGSLEEVIDAADVQKIKAGRLLQEKAEREREKEDEDEEGGDEGLKLTERLLKVKKLDADKAKPFVLALGGKAHGLVIAKGGSLSGDHKKRARSLRQGNGKLFSGKVFGAGGKYVFAFDVDPPRGLAKAIKKAALSHTKLPAIRVIVRGPDGAEYDDENDLEEMADLGTDDEAEGEGASSEADARRESTAERAEAPVDGRGAAKQAESSVEGEASTERVEAPVEGGASAELVGRFRAKIKELTPRIKNVLTARGPEAQAVDALRAQALGFGNDKAYAQALDSLAQIEVLLDKAESRRGDEGPGSAVLKRVAALSPEVKKLLAAKHASAREVGLAFSQAQTLARKGEFDQAGRLLDDVERGLEGAGVALPKTGSDGPPTPPPRQQQQEAREEFKRRMRDLLPKLLAAIKTGPEAKKALEELAGRARAAASGGDLVTALERTKELEEMVGRYAVAPRPVERTFVRLQKARLEWDGALARVRDEFALLTSIILADSEDDPRVETIRKDLAGRRSKLEALVEPRLGVVLTGVASAKAGEREKLRDEAATLVVGLKKKLADASSLAELEDNPWMPVALHSRLDGALRALAHQLES